MSFVSNPTDPNVMNQEQLEKFKDNYANMILDGMDMDSLVQLAYDYIIEGLENWTEEDMKDEILINYDEETLENLMEANK